MWLRRPAHAAWLFSALREISPIASSCLRFTILPPGVFCRMPSRSSELRAARCPMTRSAATWRKLCVDLPSAASTSGRQAGCSPAPPMSTATPTIRRRMSGSIGNSHKSNAHAPRAATGSSISRRRRQHSHQSAVISADRGSPARRTARGADSLSKNRSAPILPRRRRSIESYSGSWKNTRFIALTTTWGKRRCRISWCCGSHGLFEPIWNRDHIDHVQITVAETLTVGRRGRFYDATGALRDMVPNHLFQLFSLVAMEPPSRFEAHAVRSEKAEALDAVHVPSEAGALRDSVRAQYVAARVGDNEVEDYRRTADVAPDSTTETYVALKLMIDNWRWAGVPFYLRTGKALKSKRTEVAIKFKQAPFAMFRDTPVDRLAQNFLVISIQPDECIGLQFSAKVPGPVIAISGVGMTFKYQDYFDAAPSTGYETLIYDCMIGDVILFQRADEVEAGWRVVQPFLDAWRSAGANGLALYKAGSEGPNEADQLLARDGRRWRPIA